MVDIKNSLHNSISLSKVASHDDSKYIPKAYKELANGLEKQFADLMIKQMNQSTGNSDTSTGGQYYKDLLTSERSQAMVNQNQLGLQKVILDQIYPKRQRNEWAFQQYDKQANKFSSPIEMNDSHVNSFRQIQMKESVNEASTQEPSHE